MFATRVVPSVPRTDIRKFVLLVNANTIVPFVLNDGAVPLTVEIKSPAAVRVMAEVKVAVFPAVPEGALYQR